MSYWLSHPSWPQLSFHFIVLCLKLYFFVCAHVEVRGHFAGRSQVSTVWVVGLNSDCRAWWQASLPAETSHQPDLTFNAEFLFQFLPVLYLRPASVFPPPFLRPSHDSCPMIFLLRNSRVQTLLYLLGVYVTLGTHCLGLSI